MVLNTETGITTEYNSLRALAKELEAPLTTLLFLCPAEREALFFFFVPFSQLKALST